MRTKTIVCLERGHTVSFQKELNNNTEYKNHRDKNPYFPLLDVSVVKKAVCRYGYRWRNSSFCVEGMISLLTFF